MRPSMVTMSSSTLASMALRSTPGISSTTVNASGVSNISVTGWNVRPGAVLSVFLSTSRFCWTCSSCASDMALSLADLDRTRLVGLGARDEQSKDPVAIFGLDAVGLYTYRHRHGAIEHAGYALAAMDARLLAVADRLLAADADGVLLGLDLQVALVDARQFDNGDEVIVLLEDVDGWKTADRSRSAAHPVARDARVEGTLQRQQCFERVTETCKHRFPPWTKAQCRPVLVPALRRYGFVQLNAVEPLVTSSGFPAPA